MGKQIYHAKEDPDYQNPYIDVDEQRLRTVPDGSSKPYRYVHGGFKETNVKFSFCFPLKEQYKGRFFQYLCPLYCSFSGKQKENFTFVSLKPPCT